MKIHDLSLHTSEVTVITVPNFDGDPKKKKDLGSGLINYSISVVQRD